jgi:hypothetical protein
MKQMQKEDSAVARSLIKKLIYFDIFSHPLLPNEVVDYCNHPDINIKNGLRVLNDLKIRNLVSYHGGFYFLGNDIAKVEKRVEGNRLATQRLKTAGKYAALVANFPYVRAVFISGSLSKHVMKPDSDIDFFIITEPGRLWVCRAFLTLFKKVFLGDSYRNFCLNYFIDSDSLEIPDKNIFTATEIAFILPMYNYSLYKEFLLANQWYREEFPNLNERMEVHKIMPYHIKKILEFIFNNRFGNWLDKKSFSVITGYWKDKFSYLSPEIYSLNFRSQKNVSKHHPNSFQDRVVNKYKERVLDFEYTTGFILESKLKGEVINQ